MVKIYGSIGILCCVLLTLAWPQTAFSKGKKEPSRYEQPVPSSLSESGSEKTSIAKELENDKVTIRIGESDRMIIRHYLNTHYRPDCPPGLAKKNNGCLPPGQAKKYNLGTRLEEPYVKLPEDLAALLGALPSGYQYVQVDKDILLISEAGKKILDAVTLLSGLD